VEARRRTHAAVVVAVLSAVFLTSACSGEGERSADGGIGSPGSGDAGPRADGPADVGAAVSESGSSSSRCGLYPLFADDPLAPAVHGGWWVFADGLDDAGVPPGDCQTLGGYPPSACSTITFPPPPWGPGPYPQTTPNTWCLSGTAAQVIGATPESTSISGIGIGVDFNDDSSGVPQPYDASQITALSFTVAGLPSSGVVRVEVPEPATDATGDPWSYTLTANGPTYVFLQSGIGVGELAPSSPLPNGAEPPPFDPTMVEGLRFHAVSSTESPTPVSNFCISDLAALICF
jgi:hypothetical protein